MTRSIQRRDKAPTRSFLIVFSCFSHTRLPGLLFRGVGAGRPGVLSQGFPFVFWCFFEWFSLYPVAWAPVPRGRRGTVPGALFPRLLMFFLRFALYPVAWAPVPRGRRGTVPGAPFPKFSDAFLEVSSIPDCLGPCAAGPARDFAWSAFPLAFL